MTTAYRFLACFAAHDQLDPCAFAFDTLNLAIGAQLNALADELIEHHARAFRILARKRLRDIKDGYGSAEAAECLSELDSHRAGPEYHEMLGLRAEVENGLVRVMWR